MPVASINKTTAEQAENPNLLLNVISIFLSNTDLSDLLIQACLRYQPNGLRRTVFAQDDIRRNLFRCSYVGHREPQRSKC
jgi:hypothetical protein